jgi:hypothetical protein
MSVLKNIVINLDEYIDEVLGEERLHHLAAEFLGAKYEAKDPMFDAIEYIVYNEPLFKAWLWFDFRHKGKSMIQNFADSNPSLDRSSITELDRLARTNYMSIFKAGEIRPGNIEFTDVRTGAVYHIREYSMSSEIKTGQIMTLRICNQGDHWEIIMPNNAIHPMTIDSPEIMKEIVASFPAEPTMKDTFGYLNLRDSLGLTKSEDRHVTSTEPMSLKQAASEFELEMENAGLTRYISFKRLADNLKQEYKAKGRPLSPPLGIRILLGLVNPDEDIDKTNKILTAANNYWNALGPNKKIKKEVRRSGYTPDLHIDKYEESKWRKYAGEAYELLIANKLEEAVESYNQLFKMMLKECMVTSSVYRLVHNAGIAHLANGDLLLGTMLIDAALELSPTYDAALRQKELIDAGEYTAAAIAKAAEKSLKSETFHYPDPVKLRSLSDKDLIKEFSNCGVKITAQGFKHLAHKYRDQYDIVDVLGTTDEYADYVYGLLDEARFRWSPETVWVDTLHSQTFDLEDAIEPDAVVRSTEIKHTVLQAAKQLTESLKRADDETIKSWVNNSREYADYRQNFVLYCEEDTSPSTHAALLDLCSQTMDRTKDPIFQVPLYLSQIRSLPDNYKSSIHSIQALAKAWPFDQTLMEVMGNALAASYPLLAAKTYLLGLDALELRAKKHKWSNPPYDYESIADHADVILDGICGLYDNESEEDAKELDSLTKRVEQLKADKHTTEAGFFAPALNNESEAKIDLFPEDPVFTYLKWFKTLGINLSEGDGQTTRLDRPTVSNKVGRNDPCPCGATRPDGLPLKYKKCHGAI